MLSLLHDFFYENARYWGAASVFILSSLWVKKYYRGRYADYLLLFANVIALLCFFNTEIIEHKRHCIRYLVLIGLEYLIMLAGEKKFPKLRILAFSLPLICLIFVKSTVHTGIFYIGLSYMALRLSYLSIEVRNGSVRMPSLAAYLFYALFFPTLSIGPINRYKTFEQPVEHSWDERWDLLLRIFLGLAKYRIIAPLFQRLTFGYLWHDDYRHGVVDFLVSCTSYYLFLYFNFAGFCDIMIGIAGLAGFRVKENFNSPLLARNVKDFWNRWHITLSDYVRDVIFTPLSKNLIRFLGPNQINLAIAFSSFIVFSIVGIWHGTGWNYLFFGAFHALGLVMNHYYTVWLKKNFSRKFKWYNANALIRRVAISLTFIYVSLSFFLFENSLADMKTIFSIFLARFT